MNLLNVEQIAKRHDWLIYQHDLAAVNAAERGARVAVETVNRFPRFTPRTGKVQRSTKTRIVKLGGRVRLFVTNTHKAAAALDKGSKPHVIRPGRKKFLRFVTKGGTLIFTKKVNHPGNRPYRFLTSAKENANAAMRQQLEQEMARIARQF